MSCQLTRWGTVALLVMAVASGAVVAQSGTREYYPAPRPTAFPVTVVVRLPAAAQLEIDGVRTRQTGEVRRFVSPPLPAGQNFTYVFKATWKDGDRDVVQEKKVEVRGGTEISVQFQADAAPKTEDKPK
jgi:uncharacterized protein (TIGR03000 family)